MKLHMEHATLSESCEVELLVRFEMTTCSLNKKIVATMIRQKVVEACL